MPTPQQKRAPTIILGILITMLCLSIGAIALIILFNNNRPSSEEIALACKTEVGGAISAEYDKVVKACEEEATKVRTTTASATTYRPGFEYPHGWSAISLAVQQNSPIFVTHVSPGIIESACLGCDGPYIPIASTVETKNTAAITTAGSFTAYVTSLYQGEGYENVKVTETTIGIQKVVIVTGNFGGLFATENSEHVFFEGAKTMAKVTVDYLQEQDNTEIEKAWGIVKSSLDFSKIE